MYMYILHIDLSMLGLLVFQATKKTVSCQRGISRVIFGFKSMREVLLAGTWDTDSEPVLDEPATRVLMLKGQVRG